MKNTFSTLNGAFGALFEGINQEALADQVFLKLLYKKWIQNHGLLILRGKELSHLGTRDLISISKNLGVIDPKTHSARQNYMVNNSPILRIGNIKNNSGNLICQFSRVPQLKMRRDAQYNPNTQRPVWHTDSTFLKSPPIGSVMHCKITPPSGGQTLFCNTRTAYKNFNKETKKYLAQFEAICSLAHHDKKINAYSPNYPILTPQQRRANPATRVPLVLIHPITGQPALYGLNSSTCAIVKKGTPITQEQMDEFDLDGIEDKSVLILRRLLPEITAPDNTICWNWEPGDIVVWDNRCTLHAGTGFDHKQYLREMWRLTLSKDNAKKISNSSLT